MNKSAKELIEKMASKNLNPYMKGHNRGLVAGAAGGLVTGGAAGYLLGSKKENKDDKKKEESEKKSSMRDFIDDFIKGATHNTFGRPVNIQTQTDFSPIDMAKVAGVVVAFSQKGYSVKEASEYLGLPVSQVESIVATVG
jgi:hypothetical protein